MEINDQTTEAFKKMVEERMNDLEPYFLNMPEYKDIAARLKELYNKVNKHLPEDGTKLATQVDECLKDILTLSQRYFYMFGFLDKQKLYEVYHNKSS